MNFYPQHTVLGDAGQAEGGSKTGSHQMLKSTSQRPRVRSGSHSMNSVYCVDVPDRPKPTPARAATSAWGGSGQGKQV